VNLVCDFWLGQCVPYDCVKDLWDAVAFRRFRFERGVECNALVVAIVTEKGVKIVDDAARHTTKHRHEFAQFIQFVGWDIDECSFRHVYDISRSRSRNLATACHQFSE
jgi:hypothetical protein